MLKVNPKQKANNPLPRSSKKIKINKSDAYTSSSKTDTSFNIDVNKVELRPISQKMAKAKAKKEKEEIKCHLLKCEFRNGKKMN